MRRFHWLYLFLIVTTLCGCAPSISRHHAESLVAASHTLLEHPAGDIPETSWPEAVTHLKPKRVYRAQEGVYICTHEFFVEERGVFILDPASTLAPGKFGDPSYDLVRAGIFTYRIAG